jgi:DNA-binding GntR family transcriptional regulator
MLELAPATADVERALRHMILRRELVGGERLDLDRLAARFGVSRTVIKDAVYKLASEGVLIVQPHRGTIVPKLTREYVGYVFDARLMIELHAAGRALDHDGPLDLAEARALMAEGERQLAEPEPDLVAWTMLNRQLHTTLVRLAGNPLLGRLHERLNLELALRITGPALGRAHAEAAHAQHQALIAAYDRRDREAVLHLTREHIRWGQEQVLRSLASAGGVL